MFLLSLTATCQVWTGSLKAGHSTYNGLAPDCLQPTLLRRSRFRQQVSPGVRPSNRRYREVARATAIYSDDADVRSMAAAQDIAGIGLAALPLPPVYPQMARQCEPPTPAQEEPPGEPDEDIEAPEDEPNDGAEQEPG